MARPREFDMDQALEGAMRIFWRRGYHATNLPDLLTAMSLTRGSFYKAFVDKESVYLEALDYYDRKVVSTAVAALESCKAANAIDCLSLIFQTSTSQDDGCFICNAMIEMAPVNPRVAEKTSQMSIRIRDAIKGTLDRFDIKNPEASNQTLAVAILHLYFGQKALNRGKAGDTDWKTCLANMLRISLEV